MTNVERSEIRLRRDECLNEIELRKVISVIRSGCAAAVATFAVFTALGCGSDEATPAKATAKRVKSSVAKETDPDSPAAGESKKKFAPVQLEEDAGGTDGDAPAKKTVP